MDDGEVCTSARKLLLRPRALWGAVSKLDSRCTCVQGEVLTSSEPSFLSTTFR